MERKLNYFFAVIILILGGIVIHNYLSMKEERANEELYRQKVENAFLFTLSNTDFEAFAVALEEASRASGDKFVTSLKKSDKLSTNFVETLLHLNNFRDIGKPNSNYGLNYGRYTYYPASQEQNELQWKIINAGVGGVIYTIEHRYYNNKLTKEDRQVLTNIAKRVRDLNANVFGDQRLLKYGYSGIEEASKRRFATDIEPHLDEIIKIVKLYEQGTKQKINRK